MAKPKQIFTNGQVIYRQNEISDRAFEVLSGVVELLVDGDEGEVQVGVARAGDMFGETGLIEGGPRKDTARAIGDALIRPIVRDYRDIPKSIKISSSAGKGGLLERYRSLLGDLVHEGIREGSSDKIVSLNFIKQMRHYMMPFKGKIKVCIATLDNDRGRKQGRHISSFLRNFRGIGVRFVADPFEINLNRELSGELIRIGNAGQKLLHKLDADLLIWGHVPSAQTSVHLHFVGRKDWNGHLPGAFSFATYISLPVNLKANFANVLRSVVLAAIIPKNDEQAKLRTALMLEVMRSAASALDEIPTNFSPREQASLKLCLGNAHASLWEQIRNQEYLGQALELYQDVIAQLSGDELALDWAVAQKHSSAILALQGEEGDDTKRYDEAVAAALLALDTLSRKNHPTDWAALQFQLGIIHYKLGFKSGDTEVLRRALRYYRNSLLVYSKKWALNRWSDVMTAFGQAVVVFGENEKRLEPLVTAVDVCQAVLEVCDRQRRPLAWAAAQNNLGTALYLLGKKARNSHRLKLAIIAFENALEVYQESRLHKHGAITEKNLDRALSIADWYLPAGKHTIGAA